MSSNDLYDLLAGLEEVFKHPGILGFSPLVDELRSVVLQPPGYPPRNIIKTGDNGWMLEVALAGFNPNEIEMEEHDEHLHISGKSNAINPPEAEYLYHGLARRNFDFTIKLGPYVKVTGEPFMQHGVLLVILERVIPDSAKPKKFTIKSINDDGSEQEKIEVLAEG